MSESEEENFCFFGKPLDPYDEDAFPKKRPIALEEQIATDAQGRRRFHGAFTGGFSAGFFNTVGSLEGWTPSDFKSTRQEKAKSIVQKPQDFMDEEDIGEYGIAPQTVRATDDYSTSKKRRKQVFSDGPIPGIPVLETLLTSGNETIGYLLMKNLGIQDKVQKQQEETGTVNVKVYGCQMPEQYKIPEKIENRQYVVPDIYKEFLEKPKANTFGLGYQGLDRTHINLFTNSNLVVRDKNNKKFSIGGQAFGVGAFENEDDDIYMKEDMSNYDFELRKEKEDKKVVHSHVDLLYGMFKHYQAPLISKKLYPPPTIPHSFSGKHKIKKSRFEPVVEVKEEIDRHSINPEIRARYLGEQVQEAYTPSRLARDLPVPSTSIRGPESISSRRSFDVSSLLVDRFVPASSKAEGSDAQIPEQQTETTYGTADMREAVRMKMFGPLTRETLEWRPCAILCKRFNVPEPFVDRPQEEPKKRVRNLIFEQQKDTDEDSSLFKPGISGESSMLQKEQQETEEMEGNSIPEAPLQIKTENIENIEEQQNEVKEEEIDSAPKDITDRIGIAEKTDLFKAVFLSSSESEDEETNNTNEDIETDKTEEFKQNVLSEQLLPKIKPLKEGILSKLSFNTFVKPKVEEIISPLVEHSSEGISASSSDSNREPLYGPKLPAERFIINNPKDVRIVSSDSEDDWVEKKKEDEKKSKHKKKSKKKEKQRHEKKKKKSHKSSH
ncbi:G patch domain-containing protein 1 [Leptinotarsa decemlineata]|uniref:G patch domain-containing protein 1 n=1 Tax=Leptinotarsa decemlineata TaxID=7539 RepID=UPI003D306454